MFFELQGQKSSISATVRKMMQVTELRILKFINQGACLPWMRMTQMSESEARKL